MRRACLAPAKQASTGRRTRRSRLVQLGCRVSDRARYRSSRPSSASIKQFVSYRRSDAAREQATIVNRVNGRVLEAGASAARLVDLCISSDISVEAMRDLAAPLFERLAYFDQDRQSLRQTRGPETGLAHA